MTRHQDTGGGTLLEPPKTDEVQVIPQAAAPTKTRARVVWLLAVLIAGALAALGVWAATQSSTDDELGERPRVHPDHEADWWIHAQLREQARAAQAQASRFDPWIQARLRHQARSGQTPGGTGQAFEHYPQSSLDPDTVTTDPSTRHGEWDDQGYLNQLGNHNATAAPRACRPAISPVPC
jgi:hypothetical protein